jgi:hypothetical protein
MMLHIKSKNRLINTDHIVEARYRPSYKDTEGGEEFCLEFVREPDDHGLLVPVIVAFLAVAVIPEIAVLTTSSALLVVLGLARLAVDVAAPVGLGLVCHGDRRLVAEPLLPAGGAVSVVGPQRGAVVSASHASLVVGLLAGQCGLPAVHAARVGVKSLVRAVHFGAEEDVRVHFDSRPPSSLFGLDRSILDDTGVVPPCYRPQTSAVIIGFG